MRCRGRLAVCNRSNGSPGNTRQSTHTPLIIHPLYTTAACWLCFCVHFIRHQIDTILGGCSTVHIHTYIFMCMCLVGFILNILVVFIISVCCGCFNRYYFEMHSKNGGGGEAQMFKFSVCKSVFHVQRYMYMCEQKKIQSA